jgi:hypothetical protein
VEPKSDGLQECKNGHMPGRRSVSIRLITLLTMVSLTENFSSRPVYRDRWSQWVLLVLRRHFAARKTEFRLKMPVDWPEEGCPTLPDIGVICSEAYANGYNCVIHQGPEYDVEEQEVSRSHSADEPR